MQAYFAKWDNEGVVDLQEKLSELVILTASRTLMGAAAAFDIFAIALSPWMLPTVDEQQARSCSSVVVRSKHMARNLSPYNRILNGHSRPRMFQMWRTSTQEFR